MVAAAIIKNPKSSYLDNGLTDRHEIWHGEAIRHLRCVSEICTFKIQHGGGREKSKNRHMSPTYGDFSLKSLKLRPT